MTRELQAYVKALTASQDQLRGHLAILGDTLSSTHDLHRILRVILRSAVSATGSRAGVVLLMDASGGHLVARCAEGLAGRWGVADEELPTLRVPLGRGVLGTVAATGEPSRGACVPGGSPDDPACRTYVAVPILAPALAGDPLVPSGSPVPAAAHADRIPAGPGDWAGLGAELFDRPVPGRWTGRASRKDGGSALGVLALYDRLGGDEFDDADLMTLRTFAGQAGVAVHNVRVHEEAQRLSLTDPLTGLWNYRYLREVLRREVERASRFSRRLTVLVLDLDHFKRVNDTFGHAAGDAVLAEFARRVRVGLREVDVAFRQGGEEFVVLLPETDAYGGAVVAERLGAAVREVPVRIDPRVLHESSPETGVKSDRAEKINHTQRSDQSGVNDKKLRAEMPVQKDRRPTGVVDHVAISVSIGIAVFPDHGATARQVLDAADDALYAAKSAGRDTYRLAETVPLPEAGGKSEPETAVTDSSVSETAPEGQAKAQFDHEGSEPGASGGPHPPRQARGR
jgi:two-component system, cell cycle response regulator